MKSRQGRLIMGMEIPMAVLCSTVLATWLLLFLPSVAGRLAAPLVVSDDHHQGHDHMFALQSSKKLEVDDEATATAPEFISILRDDHQGDGDHHKFALQNSSIKLDVGEAYPEVYAEFIRNLRKTVSVYDGASNYGFPTTHEPGTLTGTNQFVLLELINGTQARITVVVRATDLYVVGFYSNNQNPKDQKEKKSLFCYFPGTSASDVQTILSLFPAGTASEVLPFGENYGQLGDRLATPLGQAALSSSVNSLFYRSRQNWAKAFLIIVQMISEAVRFPYIEELLVENYYTSYTPDKIVADLENSWRALSRRIVSAIAGVFDPIEIGDRDNRMVVDNVAALTSVIGVIMFCKAKPKLAAVDDHLLFIKSVVVGGGVITNGNIYDNDDLQPTCESEILSEVTTRVVGAEGLCLDVPNGDYRNGAPVKLWPCKSNNDANQLWAFKRDGTIRSNNHWCLNTNTNSPGPNYIMIFKCPNEAKGTRAVWEVRNDGTIVNTASAAAGVVRALTAKSRDDVLAAERILYTPAQGWLATNNTQPLVRRIVWGKNRCLNVLSNLQGYSLCLVECDIGKPLQHQWALYMHGTIRPKQIIGLDYCLACDGGICKQGTNITVSKCSFGAPDQRWKVTPSGNIVNLGSGLAMTVSQPHSPKEKIIAMLLDGHTGSKSQRWFTSL